VERAKQFPEARYISLESYRKTGQPVRTTVWLVEDAGQIYVRTDPRSGKVKRIRRNSQVRVAPANYNGQTTGEWVDGEARFVTGEESSRVLGLFSQKYGLQFRLMTGMARVRGIPPMQVISINLKHETGGAQAATVPSEP